MATQPEDDVLELGEAPEQQDNQQQVDDNAAEQEGEGEGEDDETLEIPTFGDPGEEEETDGTLPKHLREEIRKRDREIAELKRGKAPELEIVVGEKPTLESCEYDEDRFETELTAYHDRKRQAESKANEGKEAQQRAQQELAQVVTAYNEKKAALPYPDKDDMEATVLASLSVSQQEIAVRVAGDPAKLFYALGRNPAKLATLASMAVTDIATVAKFGAAIAKLDGELKMARRRPTAEPDRPVRGSASLATNVDKEEQRLIAQADKSGDRSALVKYRYDKKQAAKAG